MPSEAERNALRDVLHHIELAERFTQDYTFESFQHDELHLYAVTRCLESISEGSRRLSDELRHDYQDVAALRIWDAVQFALPPLRKVIEQELAAEY